MDLEHIPHKPGVYLLTHATTGDTYVGSSINLRIRCGVHRAYIRKRSSSRPINRLIEAHGDNFTVKVLEVTEPFDRLICEQGWIDSLRPTLNVMRSTARKRSLQERYSPSRKAKPVAIRLDAELTKRLTALGEKQLVKPTFTALLEKAIEEFLDKHEKKK